MIRFANAILYPWYNDAYGHCGSCRFRDHDEKRFSKKRCQECVPRKWDSKLKEDEYYLPTEHEKRLKHSHDSYEGSLDEAAANARMSRPVDRGTRFG